MLKNNPLLDFSNVPDMETKLKILRGEQTEVGVPDERWSISSFLDKTEQWFQDWITTSKY